MKTITFVTGNQMKVRHANEAVKDFDYEFIAQELSIIEPREVNPEKVVIEKANQAFASLNAPLVVEDSGIFIESLNGFPKTLVHFVEDTVGVGGIIKLMAGVANRKAEFRQSLAYIELGMEKPMVFNYVDRNFTVADKVWDSPYGDPAQFDRILIPPGETQPLCMFSDSWRAERDTKANFETIHYRQLVKWLTTQNYHGYN